MSLTSFFFFLSFVSSIVGTNGHDDAECNVDIEIYKTIIEIIFFQGNGGGGSGGGGSQGSLMGLGKRKRRHISSIELSYYPFGDEEMADRIAAQLSLALLKFQNFNAKSSSRS